MKNGRQDSMKYFELSRMQSSAHENLNYPRSGFTSFDENWPRTLSWAELVLLIQSAQLRPPLILDCLLSFLIDLDDVMTHSNCMRCRRSWIQYRCSSRARKGSCTPPASKFMIDLFVPSEQVRQRVRFWAVEAASEQDSQLVQGCAVRSD